MLMEDGSLMRHFPEMKNPNMNQIIERDSPKVPITNMATLHLKMKATWFSRQRAEGSNDHSFSSNHTTYLLYLLT